MTTPSASERCARCGHSRGSHAKPRKGERDKWTGCLTYKCLPFNADSSDDKCPAFVPPEARE